jgi:YidC/Oxa1 family membrane protein insertase
MTLLFPPIEEEQNTGQKQPISVQSEDSDYALGQLVSFEVKNTHQETLTASISVEARESGDWHSLSLKNPEVVLQAGEKKIVSYSSQNIDIFGNEGKYRVTLKGTDGQFFSEDEFTVSQPGIFRSLWRSIFFKPLYNILIFFLDISMSKLGLSVIFLTLFVKFILLIPSKKGIIAQQKMQKVQPEMEKMKKKYEKDPQKQAQEMLALWKKHGVNPGSLILPTLLQFPILIALFFVVKDGLLPHNSYLLYPLPIFQDFDFSIIDFDLFWLDLSIPDPYFILPVSIGILQFFQMKHMMAKRKREKKKEENSPQESIMGIMTYFLPGIVIIFSATMPSAVGVYWGVSTLFSLIQQFLLQEKKNERK